MATQTAEILQATVKYPCLQPKNTQFGLRINCVLITDKGEEVKLWGNPDDPIRLLKKGASVMVIRDGNKVKLAANSIPEEEPTTKLENSLPTEKDLDPLEKLRDENKNSQIKAYIRWHAKLYAECLAQAKDVCDPFDEHSEPFLRGDENIRAIATTLYLQTVQKFDL